MTKNGKYTKAEIKAKAKKTLERLQSGEIEREAETYILLSNQPAENKYPYIVGWLEGELKCRLTEILEEF